MNNFSVADGLFDDIVSRDLILMLGVDVHAKVTQKALLDMAEAGHVLLVDRACDRDFLVQAIQFGHQKRHLSRLDGFAARVKFLAPQPRSSLWP